MNMTWTVGASPGRCLMRLYTLCLSLTLVALINQAAARPTQGPHADLVGPPEPMQGVEPLGACCILGVCTELTNSDCTANGGEYQGAGTICDNQPCSGACCLPDKSGCQVMSLASCKSIGGFFFGGGTACAGFECPGACCGDFGCYTTTPYDCSINGDTYVGGLCENASCVIPTGACCLKGSGCFELTESDCASNAGRYQGDHTVCVPRACCPADFNNDGAVNTPDLTYFLGRFADTFTPPGSEPADLNRDGAVNTSDLTILLGDFGAPCP